MESREKPSKLGILRRTGGLIRGLAKVYSAEIPKVPVDEIDGRTVARTIYNQLGNPFQEKIKGDRWANPFSIVDVLANSGYVGAWNDTDYKEKFPEPHRRTRQALQQLVNKGILTIGSAEEPDGNKETIYYKVVDEAALKKMTEEPKGMSSQQPPAAK